MGHSGRESAFIGVGMVPRGEVGLIIAVVGFTGGIITSDIYSAAVLAVFLTTVVVPPVLRVMAPGVRTGGPGDPQATDRPANP
jgi:Kef-type K+ transport system membrane component KefB